MKKINLFGIMLLLSFGIVGCSKDDIPEISNEKFCLYLSSETMDKAVPIINDFLADLPSNLTDSQKLQLLTEWLKSKSCIIDATILCESCIVGLFTPTMSEILISFRENGIVEHLVLDIEMANPLQVVFYHRHYTPYDVMIQTNRFF